MRFKQKKIYRKSKKTRNFFKFRSKSQKTLKHFHLLQFGETRTFSEIVVPTSFNCLSFFKKISKHSLSKCYNNRITPVMFLCWDLKVNSSCQKPAKTFTIRNGTQFCPHIITAPQIEALFFDSNFRFLRKPNGSWNLIVPTPK